MAEHAKEAPNNPTLWDFINPPANVRKRLYDILLAASPLIVWYGLANDATVGLWLAFAASVLGVATARANVTPTNTPK